MNRAEGKLSNYIGQLRNRGDIDGHLVNVDRDLINIWRRVQEIIGYFPGKTYEDINIGAVTLGFAASAPGKSVISSTSIQVSVFDGNVTTEELFGVVEIPHSYREGTNITPHVHWMPITSTLANIVWQLEYIIRQDEAVDVTATSTTLAVSSSSAGTAWSQILVNFPTISGTNIHVGHQLAFRFFRDPTNAADDYPEDAAVLTIGFHFEQDKLGTETFPV